MTLSRDTRKAETRSALLRAAARLFAQNGIDATSIDRIASEVGLTKGAVYAHFANKAELVLAVAMALEAETELEPMVKILFDGSASLGERLRRMAQQAVIVSQAEAILGLTDLEVTLLDLEFFIYSLRNRDPEFVATTRKTYEELGKQLDALQKKRGEPLAFPGSTVMPLGVNLTRGLNLAHAQAPDLVPTTLYEEVYDALAKLFTKRGRGASGASRRRPRGG